MTTLVGKTSWFGGPNDSTDSGHTASGGTTKEPGIAIYNKATLGGYWRVTTPNGRTAVLRQTDIGPAPWTGRKVDVTYSALGHLGYNEHNFPTDSTVHAEYLGKSPKGTQSSSNGNRGATSTSTLPEASQGLRTALQGSFDKPGYEAAAQHARGLRAAGSLFPGDRLPRATRERARA